MRQRMIAKADFELYYTNFPLFYTFCCFGSSIFLEVFNGVFLADFALPSFS